METALHANKSQDLQAMNRISAPPNPPIDRTKYSAKFDRLWCALVHVQLKFLNSVYGHADRLLTASDRKRQQIARRLDETTKVMRRCQVFVDKLGRDNLSDQDEREKRGLATFLIERAIPFVEHWRQATEATALGFPLAVEPKDISIWFDEMLETGRRQRQQPLPSIIECGPQSEHTASGTDQQ